MDRRIVYGGQIPLEEDILTTNRYAMIGVGKLAEALMGTSQKWIQGLSCVADDPGVNFKVRVSPGQIYSVEPIDQTPYSSLDADLRIMLKQGLALDPETFDCDPPASGLSVVYLIEAAYADIDKDPTTLLYYNADNPAMPFPGPGGNGVPQNQTRAGVCDVRVKPGIASTTGTEIIPSPDPGFIGLYTIRVSSTTTIHVPTGSPTAEGIYDLSTPYRIDIGAGPDTTGFAKLAVANIFVAQNTFNFNNPTPVIVAGGTTTAGTGIRIVGDNSGGKPAKTIRVRNSAFAIQNNAGSPSDILVLDDDGNLSVTGTFHCEGTASGDDPVSVNDYVTKQWALANLGGGGDLTEAEADAKYVSKILASTQNLAGQLFVPSQGGVLSGPSNDQLATAGWCRSVFTDIASGGLTQAAGDARYVLKLDSVNETVTGVKTFSSAPQCTQDPSGNQDLVRKQYLDNNYNKKDAAAPAYVNALTVGTPSAPGHAVTKNNADASYLSKVDGGFQSVAGTVNFNQLPTCSLTPSAGNHLATKAYVDAHSGGGGGGGIDQAYADAHYAQLVGNNNMTGANTFSQVISMGGSPSAGNHVIHKSYGDSTYARLSGATFTGPTSGINATSGGQFVTWQQVFGATGFAKIAGGNTFTGGQQQMQLDTGGDIILLKSTGTANCRIAFSNGSVARNFGMIYSAEGTIPANSLVMRTANGTAITSFDNLGNIATAGGLAFQGLISQTQNSGVNNFVGSIQCAAGTAAASVVRRGDFVISGGQSSGYIQFPGGFKIQWGISGVFPIGTTAQTFGWATPFTSTPYGAMVCIKGDVTGLPFYSVTNITTTSATIGMVIQAGTGVTSKQLWVLGWGV